jgi:transcriptional regulator GlxA family with amidase domain
VSQALILQSSDEDRLRDPGGWISNHLDKNLTVPALAKKAAMSVRNFTRRFRQSFGMAPAEFVTRVRLEAVCRRLEESTRIVDQVAPECGFSGVLSSAPEFARRVTITSE